MTLDNALDSFSPVGGEMPAAGHLHSLGRTTVGASRALLAAVVGDDLGAGMRLQPAGECLRLPIRQQLHGSMVLEIHECRAVASAFAARPVAHPRTRAGGGSGSSPGSGVLRIREISVAGLTSSPMRFAKRAPASQLSAKAIPPSRVASLSVVREYGATTSGRR